MDPILTRRETTDVLTQAMSLAIVVVTCLATLGPILLG